MTATKVTTKQAVAGLIDANGAIWGGNITYSIPGASASWQAGYGSGEPFDADYSGFDKTQAKSFGVVMARWDSYIAPSITEVSDTKPGEIRIAFTDVASRTGGDVSGYGYSPPQPGNATSQVNGDIWIDQSLENSTFARYSQSFEILLHEAGHALGLKHPFESPKLPAAYESKTYTVMSYTAEDNVFNWSSSNGGISLKTNGTVDFTPMVLDIQAIQSHYGADKSTATGNNTYKFTDTGLDGRQAIYDAAGTDTFDLSALSRGSKVDLRPGAYSDIDIYTVNAQINDLAARFGAGYKDFIREAMTDPDRPAYQWQNNVGLSFSTTIENVTASNHADTVLGNDAKNTIDGLGGRDKLSGGKGNDILTGGTGSDTFMFATGSDRDKITDFQIGATNHDILDLSSLKSITSFSDLKAHHMSAVGADVVIYGGNGDVVTLEDVKLKDLHAYDFHF